MGKTTRSAALIRTMSLLLTTMALLPALAAGAAAPAVLGAEKEKGEKAMRQRLLALNEITGTDPFQRKLEELARDAKKEPTRKLLALAVKMSKEKPQPFNRNVTFLLARVAEYL